MTETVLASFERADALVLAARKARDAGFSLLDAYTPLPLEELDGLLDPRPPSRVRPVMAGAGFATAAGAYALQWWSAVEAYPINSGGRPLNSWPVFPLICFEVGVLAAAVAGFLYLLWQCALPRLYDPIFAVDEFDRASQDRFILAVATERARVDELVPLLTRAGALTVRELAR
jgi:Protein of unknown function (DUF3341)